MTTSPSWDVDRYLRHGDHRARPFHDLLARVGPLPSPAPRIVDLGCGAGNVTAVLAERWPSARITGLDSSPAMLAAAAEYAGPTAGGGSLDFAYADAAAWTPDGPLDLLVSNAVLQWVPGHTARFPAWVAALAPGGVFAFQVPGNFDSPSHALMRRVCASPRWRERLDGVLREDPVLSPAGYLAELVGLGCEVDAWETTYTHLLRGEDPVLDWVSGTGLRPVLDALGREADTFVDEYRELLREAYPREAYGTVFPFRRIFVVARRTEG
ncbi:putative trans-aconitate 2-methyltransferase [Streptomyces sp. RB5]|uniref:Trans-aconitate 2-methyltransferase n=1 Tax=Streptomyces smaragdinus TaxID=2585196 RepID=A0A7K0CV78_9ACTN|nr:trans-aconitate 2-methyltransferase [Streptomyces smaragdinus]MQY16564.1 putative trans-aconitate 2-methyltransferase [Streptomyces smaragdinus]